MKRNYIKLILVGLVVVIGGFLVFSSKQQASSSTIRIGALLPLTGNFAYFGEDIRTSLELAKHKLNEEGLDIEIVYEDSAADTKVALPAARKLIDIEKVQIIIGGPGSSANIAVAPLMEESKIIFAPISSTPKLNDAGKYIFKLDPDVDVEVKKMAGYIISKDIKEVALIFDSTSDTQLIGKNTFIDLYNEKFGKVVADEGFDGKGQLDYRTQITRIIHENPEAVYLFANQKQGGVATRQLRELGFEGYIVGWSSMNGSEFFDNAKEHANGIIITDQLFSCEGTKQMKDYCATYELAHTNRKPLKYGVNAYETLLIMGDAIKKQNGMFNQQTKQAIAEAFTNKTYTGISGKTYFDTNGNVIEKDFEFRVAKDDNFVKI